MRTHLVAATAFIALIAPVVADAAETVTYTYDALGRLVATTTSGGPNNGVSTGISYDPAGNRSTYTVTGSTASLNQRASGNMLAEHRGSSRSVGVSN